MKLSLYKQKNVQLLYSLALVVIFGALIGLAWAYISDSYVNKPTQKGHFSFGQTYSGEDLAHSLDLRLTAKASFPSKPIKTIKDLGIVNDNRQSVVSFSVPTDGLTEYGLMTTPTTPMPAGGYPVIILCHGYYNPEQYSTYTGYIGDMNFYSQHGFVVIKPDYRGQGLSSDAGKPEGAYYSMAYNTDVMSLISAVKQTPNLNKNNINLWGHSMGAYIALRAAVLSPDIKNVILLSGPVADIEDMYKLYLAPSDQDNPVAYQIRQAIINKYGSPVADPNFWSDASPINFVSRLKARVQIHVGTADQVVPPVFSADLDKALTKANKSHQYFVYQGASHGLTAQMSQIWQRSLDLLNSK